MIQASLPELQAVTAVARRGGFRAAARELGISSSAVSHAVSGLEARIGVRLFNRTSRSVALTAAGERLAAEIAPALAIIGVALENAGSEGPDPTGVLRLNMALGAARMLLAPLILEFLRLYPRMAVEIITEDALIDVIGEGFDAGVRLKEFVSPDMIAVPLIPRMRSVVVGAPSYFEKRDKPVLPHDLLTHECIRPRMASGRYYHWEFEQQGQEIRIDVPGRLVLDESGLMLEAALDGAGLGYLAEHSVAPYVANGRLVQVLDDWTPSYEGLCLYYSGRRHLPAKLRAFIDLAKRFAARV
ncbi:DNA-binding transcriptional LysR family regulator [Rhizobium mongolense]|uniref:DNA-binding transcriptional LysR family regulator n=2 Tax=Rhizobium mongolense TaxID=57676 RepID=A0ABR6IRL4_9HYPH|nr:DNA-binding transcriptional LysR family regulator [Rhizobium mongolense]TVZ65779.1 DNA-binding transcriptional LysR family regulator [Rhizobium mongolense USDA 1844]